jgi:hypothetical protein
MITSYRAPHPSELATLARAINSREETIEELRSRTVKGINETLCEVLLQGSDLIDSKSRCPHGTWLHWLRVNCPLVSERRAQRYMCLASKAPTIQLEEADSLRMALALCNLEGGSSESPKRWPAYQETILRISRLWCYVEKNPIKEWPQEGLDKAKQVLEPLARVFWPERF